MKGAAKRQSDLKNFNIAPLRLLDLPPPRQKGATTDVAMARAIRNMRIK
jgi:hypothetical protein